MRLVINCPINSLGFGTYSLNFIFGNYNLIVRYFEEIVVVPIGDIDESIIDSFTYLNSRRAPGLSTDFNFRTLIQKPNVFVPNKEDVVLYIWHPAQLTDNLNYQCKKKVGITFFERDTLTDKEIEGIKKVNTMISPSKWMKDILNNIVPCYYHRPCLQNYSVLDVSEIASIYGNLLQVTQNPKAFTLYSAGKWEKRKGHSLLLDSVSNFKGSTNIFATWSNPFTGGLKQPIEYLTQNGWTLVTQGRFEEDIGYIWRKNNCDVILLPRIRSYVHSIGYMILCSMYISLSAAEGLNMHAVEALAYKKNVMLTYNTAHKDFVSEELGIKCGIEPANDGIWFKNEGNWYPPLAEELAKLENKIYSNYCDLIHKTCEWANLVSPMYDNKDFYEALCTF